jgi:hypothetical protein
MRFLHGYLSVILSILALSLLVQNSARAHLMPSQRGTLNVVGDGAFMVLTLPVSAFKGIDADKDGGVSLAEFNSHRAAILESVRREVTLSDRRGDTALQGILLSPVASHDTQAFVSELTIIGRFALNDTDGGLRFHIGLYGSGASEQSLQIAATHRNHKLEDICELTPAGPDCVIFPGPDTQR